MNEKFFPKGSIAFFIAMIILYAIIWLLVYIVMLKRGVKHENNFMCF